MELINRQDLAARRLNELQELKARGRKLAGYFCLYVPVELLRAAGAVPIRLARADYPSSQIGERHLRADACPFCKSSLEKLLSDPLYRLMDMLIFVNTCDMMRRLPELVATRVSIPVFQLYLPRTAEPFPARIAEFEHQLRRLADFVTRLTGTAIDDQHLQNEIEIGNRLRSALRSIEALRVSPVPLLTTGELFDLISLATLLEPADLLPLIAQIKNRATNQVFNRQPTPPRLLLAGSIIAEEEREVISLLEERAAIVADVICTGARFIEGDITTGSDPFRALAEYYFNRIPCPCRRPNTALYQHIRQLIAERQVQGIVFQTLLYCDPWRFEARDLRQATGLPMLEIDHDYSRQHFEQLRTRIEAFVEILTGAGK